MTGPGRTVPKNGLVAVLSATPATEAATSRTFDPPTRLRVARAIIETCRLIPMIVTFGIGLGVLAALEALAGSIGFGWADVGVQVLSPPALHANVIDTNRRSVIGSESASHSSTIADETVVITDDPDVVASARKFMDGIDEITEAVQGCSSTTSPPSGGRTDAPTHRGIRALVAINPRGTWRTR